MTPTIWNILLACMLIVEMFLLRQSMNNTSAAVDQLRIANDHAQSWRTFANDIVNMTKAAATVRSVFDGHDVEAYSFNENDEREAKKMLTDLKVSTDVLRSPKKTHEAMVEKAMGLDFEEEKKEEPVADKE